LIKTILFDFDGVIINSNKVKDQAFRYIFDKIDPVFVEEFMLYHRSNGSKSRFEKIEYFHKKILNQKLDDFQRNFYLKKFSNYTLSRLTNKSLLISETLDFIRKNRSYNYHIVSGTFIQDLVFLCEKLGINKYFKSIEGSPTIKEILIKNILIKYNYMKEETILIGDSFNDMEAAEKNKIIFFGFNNNELNFNKNYIKNMGNFSPNKLHE